VIFFVAKIHHFAILKKSPKQHGSGELFEKFPKKITKEESYEIAKCFLEASGRFLEFFFLNRHI
jgi:hypothetical protein